MMVIEDEIDDHIKSASRNGRKVLGTVGGGKHASVGDIFCSILSSSGVCESLGNLYNSRHHFMVVYVNKCRHNVSTCKSLGLSYVSFSMALGGFYIWTHTYHLLHSSSDEYKALQASKETLAIQNEPNQDLDATQESHLLISADKQDQDQEAIHFQSTKRINDNEFTKNQPVQDYREVWSLSVTQPIVGSY
ncbi:hypothetical protein C5167_009239 [Papaver somniferum]|uniref:Uncharacterized protein n=1 Tax=Papaver somniferum TaxID=3469 RepID=A0A4Y7JZQ3_PAPSO|nr:hypothetical protein C5167_009239 [Papaver somniferum]